MKNIIEFIIVCLLVVLSVPFANYVGNQGNIVRLNNSISIENVELLLPIEESKEAHDRNYIELYGYGGRSFQKRDGSVTVFYSGYPDVMDDYHLTRVIVESGAYEVYGITIGSTVEEMNLKMENAGFSMKLVGSKYVYTKNKISVIFHENYKNEVNAFEIIIETTNKDQVVF
jgi:hypothetical protein